MLGMNFLLNTRELPGAIRIAIALLLAPVRVLSTREQETAPHLCRRRSSLSLPYRKPPCDAVQCSLTCGSVRRVMILAAVSSVTFQNPCNASSCILYSDRYIIRANQPSIQRLGPTRPPMRFPTTEYSPSEMSEPKSR